MSMNLPMTPAQSWALIALLFIGAALAAYAIYYLDIVFQLIPINVSVAGVRGIFFAFQGKECYLVTRERVIEVAKSDLGYRATTSDGSETRQYQIIVSREDRGNAAYDEAEKLAGDDEILRKSLLPDSRVKNYFTLEKEDETVDFFVVYLKYNNEHDVESALNAFFEEEYYDELRTQRDYS